MADTGTLFFGAKSGGKSGAHTEVQREGYGRAFFLVVAFLLVAEKEEGEFERNW